MLVGDAGAHGQLVLVDHAVHIEGGAPAAVAVAADLRPGEVAVKVGEAVTAGQKLASIEAMKMENTISAMQDGVVAEICAKEGESLAVDQLIIRFE